MAGWDTVPWFVGGGAQHSAEVARVLAYAAMRGNEGVLAPGDLAVRALGVPGGQVTVDPGVGCILCRSAGQLHQAYTGRLPTLDPVTIAPTDSSGGRSDLVIARVEDPFLAGEPWPDPADPTVGPYIFTRVIPNVPPTTKTVAELGLGYSAIELARVDIPMSTGAFTQAMIKDLRKVANPRRERNLISRPLVTAEETTLTSSAYVTFPTVASFQIPIPAWASQVKIVGTWGQIQNLSTQNFFGSVRITFGSLTTQDTIIDSVIDGGSYRTNIINADTLAIPASMRGTTQTLKMQGVRSTGAGSIQADGGSSLVVDYEFSEVASLI